MSDDEDDWENAGSDLDIDFTVGRGSEEGKGEEEGGEEEEEDDWEASMKVKEKEEEEDEGEEKTGGPAPPKLFIMNVTKFTDGAVHNKHDKNSNNNPEEVSRLRKEIEANWEGYEKNVDYVSSGIVIPCGGSVWKEALMQLRDDHPGEFFLPVFKR